jgi:hypothetical protein
MEVVGKFPSVFSKEMNLSLEEEVMEPKLRVALFSMKNGKIPGPDGVMVELFKSFYNLLKDDLYWWSKNHKRKEEFTVLSIPLSFASSQKNNAPPPLKTTD